MDSYKLCTAASLSFERKLSKPDRDLDSRIARMLWTAKKPSPFHPYGFLQSDAVGHDWAYGLYFRSFPTPPKSHARSTTTLSTGPS